MFRNRSIATRLTWMNLLVSGSALCLACASFIVYDLFTFRQSVLYNLSIQAQVAGSNSISALLFNDPNSAQTTLAAFRASPNIVSAGIQTPDGRPFATYHRDPAGATPHLPVLPLGKAEAFELDANNLVLIRVIDFQGRPAGIVYVESDLDRLRARLRQYVEISAIVLATSLLAALCVSVFFQRAVAKPIVSLANAARTVSRDKDYSLRVPRSPESGELAVLVDAFNEMLAQIQERDSALRQARNNLEKRVEERTRELATTNRELEAFSYSVSHDLRAPLRSIDGFSQALLEDCAEKIDSTGRGHLQRVRLAAQRMARLIDDLLNLSRVNRSVISHDTVDLSDVANSVAAELRKSGPDRQVEFRVAEGLTVKGDSRLLRVAVENLLSNAWKYTSAHPRARIEFGCKADNGKPVYFVRDDGAGFDARYSDRLFGAFQRLHTEMEFPGTGVGLATVQRIIHRHGGEIWAEGAVEKGATFFFTLQ